MLRRFYTVMVVPHEGGALRRLSVSMNFVVSMAGIFLFCFVSSAFLAHFFLDGMHRTDKSEQLRVEIERLSVENAQVRGELQKAVLKMEDLTGRLEEYKDLNTGAPGSDEAMGGELPSQSDGDLSLDSDWRSSSQAAQDKVDYWIHRLEEQICSSNMKQSSLPTSWPLAGPIRLTSCYSWRKDPINGSRQFHDGLDLAASHGTPVHATGAGVVVIAHRKGGYGNMVRIDHGHGLQTLYGHLSSFKVREGDRVLKGDVIGAVGSTGRSTGPHLHFELLQDGKPVDPRRHLDPVKIETRTGL